MAALVGLAILSHAPTVLGQALTFSRPWGVATDSSGNIYVAEADGNTIRKITPAGAVSTLAGLAGAFGSADGTGSAARFNDPLGVATDSSGNVYVADQFNHTIRKITPAGAVTTIAGLAGDYASADGTGSAARFFSPVGVATDSSGNVYVADSKNCTIRKITSAGAVTTLAGLAGACGSENGTGSAARFHTPRGVATDTSGNVYVADTQNNTIRKITPAGAVTTLAGWAGPRGSADGTGMFARFYYPHGMAIDSSGNVYVADTYNHTIRKITPAGAVTTLAGLGGFFPSPGNVDGTGSAAQFNYPYGMAIDSSGNVYVADSENNTIRKITPAGVVTTLAAASGAVPGDANGDGIVNAADLTIVQSTFQTARGAVTPSTSSSDCNGDGQITARDVLCVFFIVHPQPAGLTQTTLKDIDRSGAPDALTDGLLLLRRLFGFSGSTLTNLAVAGGAVRTGSADIQTYIDTLRPMFDIDGNGTADALTDGLLLLRFLFGFRGNTLINGAIGPGALRTDAASIEAYLTAL